MLSYDLYAVVKDGMHLGWHKHHGFLYMPSITNVYLFERPEKAQEHADAFDGTVHQVTIVSVPLTEAMEK